MESTPLNLVVIVASTREGRFAPVVANWFTEQARSHGEVKVDVIDLAEVDIPYVLGGESTAELAAVSSRLAEADAFVVVTPEYNHSYPASLKAVIDWHHSQWHAKPVGFVSYGGLSGGLRAVEHLRQVFAEVHSVTVRDTVSFHAAWERFDETGRPRDAAADGAAKKLLDQLLWWGRTLREGRTTSPYQA
ncbi:NADPH-dependent FMN reductase [Kitasatospora sp. McL0602]|uniref:NADPH-dependent FMN reductase n=1 Tax=Kitasatospora sp. McL0602 TaxID=3439530 RepID=UPI003F8CF01B